MNQPPMPPPMGQPQVPHPSIGQPPHGIPPPPPPVGIPPVIQSSMAHSIMGQPPIMSQSSLNTPMPLSQPIMPQPHMGLTPINQSSMALSIRNDLMPSEMKEEMETDPEEFAIAEAECEPPAPGTEEPPIEDMAPSPSKFLLFFL